MAAATGRGPITRTASSLTRTLATVAIVGLLAAVWQHYQPPNREIAFPAGEIRIGVDASFPPFAFIQSGALAGLDIDLAEAIAAEIGLPVRFVNVSFYGLYDALKTGEADLLVAALTVDQARTAQVRYTTPYYDDGLVLVVAPGEPTLRPNSLPGVAIAYEYASRADSQIRKWETEGQMIMRRPYELPDYALDALRLGHAMAALVDATTLRLYASGRPDWEHQVHNVSHEPYAIAVRIDRDDAFKLIDRALGKLKETGELARMVERWF